MRALFELDRVAELTRRDDPLIRSRVLATVDADGHTFPIHGLVIGTTDRTAPTLGLFGGVHGLERVGTHVAIAWLESLVTRLSWDDALRRTFEQARLVSMPLINPGGMFLGRRSNPRGVDLMRNAPVEAMGQPARFIGGHRLSNRLPWYRGAAGRPMEPEAQALVDFVKQEVFPARAALTLDCHSGFGTRDRLWYPYAKTSAPFPRAAEARAIGRLIDAAHPHHVYIIEPQATQYTTHGDLWDHIFDAHRALHGADGAPLVPWTLEMGSWAWVRKNPRQALSPFGPFNPMIPHRYRRTMRRHLMLFELMWRAILNPQAWHARR